MKDPQKVRIDNLKCYAMIGRRKTKEFKLIDFIEDSGFEFELSNNESYPKHDVEFGELKIFLAESKHLKTYGFKNGLRVFGVIAPNEKQAYLNFIETYFNQLDLFFMIECLGEQVKKEVI
jgi:hypothetical protein